jgi:WD40 repeat protein/serine/threonine protein kinase
MPLTCPTTVELQALLNGSLSELDRVRVDRHLEECSACRRRLDELTGSDETWLEDGHVPAPGRNSPPLQDAMNRLKAGMERREAGPGQSEPTGTRQQRIGDYQILEELGRGGMGVVYRARQLKLQRDVALKVILSGEFASSSAVRRFYVEAEAAAKLDHPHIVPIFEIGEHEGHHFYSMRLVEGGSLSERISNLKSQISNREAASLLATIARAVHYAHQRGVLHRDLKPANILIDRAGQPHVTDFGLAKLMEHDSSLTHSAAIMGSPNYMAPEVAAGHARDATTASDVYSLGGILYELLTGRPPFQAESVAQTVRKVIEEEPASPATLNAAVPADLATICLKCLEKDPSRRYASAELLAEELDRFRRGEPILARPVSQTERLWRWCRRQPALAASLAALLMVFTAGFAGVLWKWQGEVHHRRLAQQAVTRLEIERAESLLQAGDSSRGLAYLARLLRQQPTNFVVAERLMSALTDRSFCLPIAALRHGHSLDTLTGERKQKLANRFAFEKPGSVVTVNFSPNGQRVVTASRDGTARIWNAFNGEPLGQPMRHDAEVLWAQFNNDGSRIVTASVDGTARIWEALTGQLAAPPLRHDDIVHHATFSPDGQKVITASRDKTARVWNTWTGEPVGLALAHPGRVYFASFSPDGRRILTADDGDTNDVARLWDAETGAEMASADHFYFTSSPMPFPHFSPSLEQVLTLRWHFAALRNVSSNLASSALLKHDDFCMVAGYSPDGRRLVTASADTTARLWDPRTGDSVLAPLRHDGRVWMADFSADGQKLVTCSRDKTARLWDTRIGRALTEAMWHEHSVLAARINTSGHRVATVSESDDGWLWDARPRQPLVVLRRMPVIPLYTRFSRDGRHLAVVNEADFAQVWNAMTGEVLIERMQHGTHAVIFDAQFSPDGRRLLTSSDDRTIQAWDSLTGEPLGPRWRQPRTAERIRFSPDGRQLGTAAADGVARLLEAETGHHLFELRHSNRVHAVEFSHDGKWLVTASADGTARIWEVATGRPLVSLLGHEAEVYHAQFDRAAGRVATASKDKTVRLWSAQTGRMLAPPLVHADELQNKDSVTFSPDETKLATVAGNAAQVWDAATSRAITTPLRHDGRVLRIQFSPDGRKLLTCSEDGTARLWDPATGHPISEVLRHGGGVKSAEFSPDGTRVVTCSADKVVRVWEITSAPLPAPEWLPALAEAVAAQRIDADDSGQAVPLEEHYRLRQRLASNREQSHYGRWARWFFADGASRAISPASVVTVPEYVQRRIEDNTRESLHEATLLSGTNVIAFARYAEHLSTSHKLGRFTTRAVPEDAEWFSRYATNLAPNDPEALRIRGQVFERLSAMTNSPTSGTGTIP